MSENKPLPTEDPRNVIRLIDEQRARNVVRADEPPPYPTRPYSEVQTEDWSWLWEGIIPLHEVTYFEGYGGDGKSSVIADIACRTSTGIGFPGDPAPRSPAGVLVFTTEESPSKTIKRRLTIGGADQRYIRDIDITQLAAQGADKRFQNIPGFRFPSGAGRLSATIAKCSQEMGVPVKLVAIDGVLSTMDSVGGRGGRGLDPNSAIDVRCYLDSLRPVAVKHNCAIVLIRHPSKARGGMAAARAAGSQAWNDWVRVSWLVGREPGTQHRDWRRVLVNVKPNAPVRNGLYFRTEWVPEQKEVRLVWGDDCTLTADDVYAAREQLRQAKPKKKDVAEAADTLIQALEVGRAEPSHQLGDEMAKAFGLSSAVYHAALTKLASEGRLARFKDGGGVWMVKALPFTPPATPKQQQPDRRTGERNDDGEEV